MKPTGTYERVKGQPKTDDEVRDEIEKAAKDNPKIEAELIPEPTNNQIPESKDEENVQEQQDNKSEDHEKEAANPPENEDQEDGNKEDGENDQEDGNKEDGENDQEAENQEDKDEKLDNQEDKPEDDTEKNEDETEKQGDQSSVVSPTTNNRPSSSKSEESGVSKTTKKTKTIYDSENQGTEVNKEQSKFKPVVLQIDPNKSTMFEDEAFQVEQRQLYVDVGTFLTLIKQFLEENEDIILLDNLHEFDEKIEEAFKAMTDINYDPFVEKLKKTLEQYENALVKGDFKDSKERQVTQKIVFDLKDQIFNITQARDNTSHTHREVKKQKLTLEEMRK